MPKSTDLQKSWIRGPSRGTTTFNSPGNISIAYGRYVGNISGVGSPGNAPTVATYNTNYNVAYPVGNRPIGTQPAATWNTNYSASYPIAGYGVGHNPGHDGQFITSYGRWDQYIQCGPMSHGINSGWWGYYGGCPGGYHVGGGLGPCPNGGPANHGLHINDCIQEFNYYPGNSFNYTNYNTVYAIANQPAATWNTNYNTNYNKVYPIANQPIGTYNTATAGAPATVFGVTFPGGNASNVVGSPNPAAPVAATRFSYWSYPDNKTHAVAVPPGGQVSINIS